MEIKQCMMQDFNDIKDLFIDVFTKNPWNDDWSNENQLNAYLMDLMGQQNSLTFGLYKEEQLIGFSLGRVKHWYEGTEYYIDELCISTTLQKKGYGTKFIELLEMELYKRDIQHFLFINRCRCACLFFL